MGLLASIVYSRRKRQAVRALKQELTDAIADEAAREALLLMLDAGAVLWYAVERNGVKSDKTRKAKRAKRRSNELRDRAFPAFKTISDDRFSDLIIYHVMLALDSVITGSSPEEAWCRGLAARLMYDMAPAEKMELRLSGSCDEGKGKSAKIRMDNVVYHALGCPVEAENMDTSAFSSWWRKFCGTPLLDHEEAVEWGSAVAVMVQFRISDEWPEKDEWGELCSAMVRALRLQEIREKIDGRTTPRRLIDEYLSKHAVDSSGEQDAEPDLAAKTLLRAQKRLEYIELKEDMGTLRAQAGPGRYEQCTASSR